MLLPKESRKRLREQTKFMLFDDEASVKAKPKPDTSLDQSCSSGISMHSS